MKPEKSNKDIVKVMISYSKKFESSEASTIKKPFTGNEANEYLLGVMLDRSVKYELACSAGESINRTMGSEDDTSTLWKNLIRIKGIRLDGYLRYGNGGKAFHRHWKTFAKQLPAAAKFIIEEYEGDPRKIWNKQKDPRIVEERLKEIPSIGPALAKMAVKHLVKARGLIGGENSLALIDVKPDIHVIRVFKRAGLAVKNANTKTVVEAARKLSPDDPSLLDTAAWNIGRNWCHKTKPNCDDCVITKYCQKYA